MEEKKKQRHGNVRGEIGVGGGGGGGKGGRGGERCDTDRFESPTQGARTSRLQCFYFCRLPRCIRAEHKRVLWRKMPIVTNRARVQFNWSQTPYSTHNVANMCKSRLKKEKSSSLYGWEVFFFNIYIRIFFPNGSVFLILNDACV